MLRNVLINEVHKLSRKRGIYVYTAAVAGFIGFMAIGLRLVGADGAADIGQKYGVGVITGDVFPLIMINEIGGLVLPIFAVFLIGALVSGEVADGTIGLSLLRPVRRSTVVLAKFAAAAIGVVALMVVMGGVSYGVGVVFFGWVGSFSFAGVESGVAGGIAMTCMAFAATALPVLGFAAIALAVSVEARSTPAAIAVGAGVLFGTSIVSSIVRPLRPAMITSYFGMNLGAFPIAEASFLVTGALVSCAYIAVFTSIAAYRFERRDILG